MNDIEKAIQFLEESLVGAMVLGDTELCEVNKIAITALREKLERQRGCGYCNIAIANDGVINAKLWVKEAEISKWTMMGKKINFCPMCGRRLKEVVMK